MKVLTFTSRDGEMEYQVQVDDNFADWFKKRGAELVMNNYGYPMIFYDGKLRPLHAVVYKIYTGVYSQQGVTGVHHKNGNKLDAQRANLELVQWHQHMQSHHPKSATPPNPKGMKII